MILAADNLTVTAPAVARALADKDPEPIRRLVRRAVDAGARMLDINPGPLSPARRDRMSFLVRAVESETDLPLILDSPDPEVLAAGLAACSRPPVLSGISGDERRLAPILALAREHGTDLVVFLMDERSAPPLSVEDKIALALTLRERCLAAGLAAERLIYDPLLPNLSMPDADRRVAGTVMCIRLLGGGTLLPEEARTMVGLSNLRSGVRKRYPAAWETICLGALAGAGLTCLLADALDKNTVSAYQLADRLTSS